MDIENLIVIVTYNSRDFIEDCIKSVAASDIKKCFLVVVDNNSSDGTPEKLASVEGSLGALQENQSEGLRFKFINLKKNIGFSAAVNYCVFKFFLKEYPKAAENTKFLILINPDVLVGKSTITNLISTFGMAQCAAGASDAANLAGAEYTGPAASAFGEVNIAGAAGSLIYDYKGEKIQHAGGLIQDNFITSHIESIPAGIGNLIESDYATGAVFATKFKYFLRLKGFDTGYRPVYFEEVDFCLKLQKLKLKIFTNASSVARHFEGASIGKFSADFYRYYHKNRVRCAIINLSFAGFLKRFMPAEIKWLKRKATPDQYKALVFAYFLNFLFLIYNLAVKIKNVSLTKGI
jgi:GT2 family glycosyltransferase